MKRVALFITLVLVGVLANALPPLVNYTDTLIAEMLLKTQHMEAKEQTINKIKQQLETPFLSGDQQYEIYDRLAEEYSVYKSDSAILYTQKKLELAREHKQEQWQTESSLQLANLYTVAGMYIEVIEILESLRAEKMNNEEKVLFYNVYKDLYNNYSSISSYADNYRLLNHTYQDSLLQFANKDSFIYLFNRAEQLLHSNKVEESEAILKQLINNENLTRRERAMSAFILADIYLNKGEYELAKMHYAQSAILDIRGNIKENTATRALAALLYKEGEIGQAYLCARSSMEDAQFCNARLRTREAAEILPIIDTAYRKKINKEKKQLKITLFVSILFAIGLVVISFYLRRKLRQLNHARKELNKYNVQLEQLNNDLRHTILELNQTNEAVSISNQQLAKANRIKENYIAQFLDLCSNYIIKLEKYQNTLNKKAATRQLDDLYKMLKSKDMINQEVKNLYKTFDYVFLHLYPNFINEFNQLLKEDERIVLEDDETLNIELRIFALIRMGIKDSSKIAQFLHYSPNTIYSYRTRIRNKAAGDRDSFEERIMQIETS